MFFLVKNKIKYCFVHLSVLFRVESELWLGSLVHAENYPFLVTSHSCGHSNTYIYDNQLQTSILTDSERGHQFTRHNKKSTDFNFYL